MNLFFWKPKRYKYRIILKSGASFKFTATDLNLTWRNDDMQLTKYNATDAKGEVPRHVSPLEIAVVLRIN